MVREILDPSAQISDQFRTHIVLTRAGRSYEGRVINRNDSSITVSADPKRPASVVQISVDEIEEMVPSKVSMMPKGNLNHLELDEVLDLFSYILSDGKLPVTVSEK